MIDMKDREEGFERKFAFDEELRFKASARRNKALGLWAAEKLGKSDPMPKPMPSRSWSPTSRKLAITTFSARYARISTKPGSTSRTTRFAAPWTI